MEAQQETRGPSATKRRRHSRLMSNSSVMTAASAVVVSAGDKHKISNTEAIVHMVKATIGGGFLAMPEAFSNAGLLVGSVGTVIMGLSVLNMMSSIVRMSQALRSGKYAMNVLAEQNNKVSDGGAVNQRVDNRHGKLQPKHQYSNKLILPPMDYPETVAAVFQYGACGRFSWWAPFFKHFSKITLAVTYYGVNIIYVCILAGTFKQLIDHYTAAGMDNSWVGSLHGLSIRWYPIVTSLLIFPVGMVRLIKYLVPFSMAANACLLVGAGAVFYFIAWDDGMTPLGPEERAKLVIWPATHWSLFAGSTLCSMEGVGMLLHIENAMKKPLELAGPPTYTLHRSMVLIILLNGLLGFFGYIRYGSRCAGSISLNLPSGNKLSEAVKVMIAIGILLTYGLQLTVTVDLAWQKLRSILVKDHGVDGLTEEEEDSSPRLTAYYYGLRFVMIFGTILIATAVPDIGPLISLVGSVGLSILGLILPVLMETVWYWSPDHGYDDEEKQGRSETLDDGSATSAVRRRRFIRSSVRHVKNVCLFAMAVFALVGGAFYNVRDIANAFSGDGHGSPDPTVVTM
ncbi:Amino acid transporter, transmembrane domain [Cinara cedri]|uniref:Amino acid transporter, transmembrane domain n=1 Tax=Cinara cedri TaxID=506608 RepID=A0A5E4N5P4_9HEMI|nr:Amino acid transporter, transmembrane domain [Cinara cedri]